MALKISIHAATLLCLFLIHTSLQSMEKEEPITQKDIAQTEAAENTIIKNLGELKKSWDSKDPIPQQPDIDPIFMAGLLSNLHTNTSETSYHSHLKKNLIALKRDSPKRFGKIAKGILEYCNKYDGDLSPENREKVQKTKDTSSSAGSQPLVTATISEINAAEIRKLKKQMKQITLQATEDTIREKENEAERNKKLGFGVSIACTVITALGTYYGALASHPAAPSCPPCSPTPPFALPAPPGTSPI